MWLEKALHAINRLTTKKPLEKLKDVLWLKSFKSSPSWNSPSLTTTSCLMTLSTNRYMDVQWGAQ